MPADTLSLLATIQPSCKTLHETIAHPRVTRPHEYIQSHKVPRPLDEAKRLTENRQPHNVRSMESRFLRPPGSDFIQSAKPWERQSIDIVGPIPMTGSKNQYLPTVVNDFISFPSAICPRIITSGSFVKGLLTIFAISPQGSFSPTWTRSSCHWGSKTSAAKRESRPPKLHPTILRAIVKTSATMDLF